MNRTASSLKARLRATLLKKPGWNADPRLVKNHLTGTFVQRPVSPDSLAQSAPNFDIVDIYSNEVRESITAKEAAGSEDVFRPKTNSEQMNRFANSNDNSKDSSLIKQQLSIDLNSSERRCVFSKQKNDSQQILLLQSRDFLQDESQEDTEV